MCLSSLCIWWIVCSDLLPIVLVVYSFLIIEFWGIFKVCFGYFSGMWFVIFSSKSVVLSSHFLNIVLPKEALNFQEAHFTKVLCFYGPMLYLKIFFLTKSHKDFFLEVLYLCFTLRSMIPVVFYFLRKYEILLEVHYFACGYPVFWQCSFSTEFSLHHYHKSFGHMYFHLFLISTCSLPVIYF